MQMDMGARNLKFRYVQRKSFRLQWGKISLTHRLIKLIGFNTDW